MDESATFEINDDEATQTTMKKHQVYAKLQVGNLNGALATGQSFQIVSAANATGNFGSIVPSPGAGLAWSFNPTNGTLNVVAGTSNPGTNLTYTVTGGQITLSWPESYIGWYLQVRTNPIAVGLSSNWVTLTNSSTTNLVAFPVDGSSGTVFYRMSLLPLAEVRSENRD